MRKKLLLIVVLAFCWLPALSACTTTGGSFTTNSYKTLLIAGETYNAGIQMVAHADKAGMLSPSQKVQILGAGNVFYTSYQTAQQALLQYAIMGQSNATAMQEVQMAMSALATDMNSFNNVLAAVKAMEK